MVQKRYVIIAGLLLTAAIIWNIYDSNTGFQFDVMIPSTGVLLNDDSVPKDINFQITNKESRTTGKLEVIPVIENAFGSYLKVEKVTIDPMIGKKSTTTDAHHIRFSSFQSEGYELKYVVNLVLNELTEKGPLERKSTPIAVTITPRFIPPKQSFSSIDLKYEKIDDVVELYGNAEKDIHFTVKSTANKKFSSIEIIPDIENSRGNYLEIKTQDYTVSLDGQNATTTELSLPIKSIKTEGSELKYKVNLGLYADGLKKDTHQIDVTIKP